MVIFCYNKNMKIFVPGFKKVLIFFILLITIPVLSVFLLKDIFPCSSCSFEIGNKSSEEELLKEKIGQMIMVGFRGTEIEEDSYIVDVIKDVEIGGVIFFDFDVPSKSFPRNVINPEQTKNLIADLQNHSSVPLFIAVDVEGGEINRLDPDYGFSDFPSPEELGEVGNYSATEEVALDISQELKGLGFNMNFAPVVDVNINPENPVIGKIGRSFSSDYQEVSLHGQAFIEAHNQNSVIAVAKHFPGHGSSLEDSHLGLVDVTETYREEELIPYKEFQEKELLKAVMTAHVFNKNIDKDYPVTLSPNFIKDILREEIGFEGVVISDDMQMGAIVDNYERKEAIMRAINSGCDVLLFSNNSEIGYDKNLPYEIQEIIYHAVLNGEISEERIEESYNRIMELKRDFIID